MTILLIAYCAWCWLRLINSDIKLSLAAVVLAPLLFPVFVLAIVVMTVMEYAETKRRIK